MVMGLGDIFESEKSVILGSMSKDVNSSHIENTFQLISMEGKNLTFLFTFWNIFIHKLGHEPEVNQALARSNSPCFSSRLIVFVHRTFVL